jgi:Polyketide cyclase / dehydrase and lipid transport
MYPHHPGLARSVRTDPGRTRSPQVAAAAVRAAAALMLLAVTGVPTRAAQVLDVRVTRDAARFLIAMRVVVDAPAPAVFRALQDYPAMPSYNPDLRTAVVEPTAEPNRVRLFTTVHTCVLLFCRTLHQEQLMTATTTARGGILRSELVPASGAFGGRGRWTVSPCGAGSSRACMDVQIVLVPAFWVPPVLGPWLIGRKMQEEAQLTSQGIEQLARGAGSNATE